MKCSNGNRGTVWRVVFCIMSYIREVTLEFGVWCELYSEIHKENNSFLIFKSTFISTLLRSEVTYSFLIPVCIC
jgi:hypothetical protein